MPELPDVEIFRRVLERHGLNRIVTAVEVRDPRILVDITPAAFARALAGDRLLAARRHGKNLFAARGRGGHLRMHFGMTGGLEPFREEPPAHARILYRFEQGPHLAHVDVRRLGRVGLVEDVEAWLEAEGIGPDALDPALTAAWFAEALGGGRRRIKAALTDQGLVAGIGNVYADEILFRAGLRPDVPVSALDRGWRERLFAAMREVLRTAVDRGAAAERHVERLPEDYLTKRREKGAHCPRCDTPLEILRIGGRTSYFCPRCQVDPRR